MLDALKQVEARAPESAQGAEARAVARASAASTSSWVSNSTESAARIEATAEQIASALAEAQAADGGCPKPGEATPEAPSAALPAPLVGRRFSDRAAGGDWLAEIAGSDLRPGSRLGSQYRRLRDRILSQLPRAGSAALLVVSADRDTGTTTTTIHLASVLAEVSSGDVLVIDADGRHGDLARRLGIDAAYGLADVLAGRVAWQGAVVRIPPGCVQVLASCSKRVVATDDLATRLATLVADLKRRYRMVIVDGGIASSAEATAWPSVCDGVYLCLELEETSTSGTNEAISRLRRAGGRILGCIATRAGQAN